MGPAPAAWQCLHSQRTGHRRLHGTGLFDEQTRSASAAVMFDARTGTQSLLAAQQVHSFAAIGALITWSSRTVLRMASSA